MVRVKDLEKDGWRFFNTAGLKETSVREREGGSLFR